MKKYTDIREAQRPRAMSYLDVGHDRGHKVTAFALSQGKIHYVDLKNPKTQGHYSEELFPNELFDNILVQGRIDHTTKQVSVSSGTDKQKEYVMKHLRKKYSDYKYFVHIDGKGLVLSESKKFGDVMFEGLKHDRRFQKYWYDIKSKKIYTMGPAYHHIQAALFFPEHFGISDDDVEELLSRNPRSRSSISWDDKFFKKIFSNDWVRVLLDDDELLIHSSQANTGVIQSILKNLTKEYMINKVNATKNDRDYLLTLNNNKEVEHFAKTGRKMSSMQTFREETELNEMLTRYKGPALSYVDIGHRNNTKDIELWYMKDGVLRYVKQASAYDTHYSLGLLDDRDPRSLWGRIDHKEKKISLTYDSIYEKTAIHAAKTLNRRFKEYEIFMFKGGDSHGVYMYEQNLQEKMTKGIKVDRYLVNPSQTEFENFFRKWSESIRLLIDPNDNKLYVWNARDFIMHQDFFSVELMYSYNETQQLYAHGKNHSNTGHIVLDHKMDKYHTFYVGENILNNHGKLIEKLQNYIERVYEYKSFPVNREARATYYEFEPTILIKENSHMRFKDLLNKLDEKISKDDMPCNKPRTDKQGGKKSVVKACKDGKEKIIRFGDADMSIKKDQPERKKSYCARSGGIKGTKDNMTANFWSRKAWDCNEENLSEADIKLGKLTVDFKAAKNVMLPLSKKAVRQKILRAMENPGASAVVQILYDGAAYQGNIAFDGKKWSFKGKKMAKQDQSKPMSVNLKDIRYLQVPVR